MDTIHERNKKTVLSAQLYGNQDQLKKNIQKQEYL